MAGLSKKMYILLLFATIVSAEERPSLPNPTENVHENKRDLHSNSALCKLSSLTCFTLYCLKKFILIISHVLTSNLVERLFQHKRSEHKDAVQRIVGMKSIEKQNKLLELVITKIMEVGKTLFSQKGNFYFQHFPHRCSPKVE